jgi:hypothetical protein
MARRLVFEARQGEDGEENREGEGHRGVYLVILTC